jgi:hypothetical protein
MGPEVLSKLHDAAGLGQLPLGSLLSTRVSQIGFSDILSFIPRFRSSEY